MLNFWDFADKHPYCAALIILLAVVGATNIFANFIRGVQSIAHACSKPKEIVNYVEEKA